MAQFYTPPLIARSPDADSINQITKIVLASGEQVAFTDWTDRPLYSTADLLSGFTDERIALFSYAEGERVAHTGNIATPRSATLEDTNISNASEMDATQEFLCYSIQNEVFQVAGTSAGITSEIARPGAPMPRAGVLALMHWRLTLGLRVSQKFFPQAGYGWFLAGFGPVVTSTLATSTLAVNGQPGHHARFDQSVPIHIGGTEKYEVWLQNEGTGATVAPATGDGSVNFPDDNGVADPTCYVISRTYMRGLHKRPMG